MDSITKENQEKHPLESLRTGYTEMTQDQFCVSIGIPRSTYQDMVKKGNKKMGVDTIANTCRACQISLQTFFEEMGVDISGIPEKIKERRKKSLV
jgi:hypothetical protein